MLDVECDRAGATILFVLWRAHDGVEGKPRVVLISQFYLISRLISASKQNLFPPPPPHPTFTNLKSTDWILSTLPEC